MEEMRAEPHGEKKMRIDSCPASARDVPSLAAGTALRDSDNGGDQVDGDRVEVESIKKSLEEEFISKSFSGGNKKERDALWSRDQLPVQSPMYRERRLQGHSCLYAHVLPPGA